VCGCSAGIKRNDRLQYEVRVEPAVGEPKPALSYLIEEELANRFAAQAACRVVSYCIGCEQVREVVP
jgi:hypothetical protein